MRAMLFGCNFLTAHIVRVFLLCMFVCPCCASDFQDRIVALEEQRKKALPLSQLEQEEQEEKEKIRQRGVCARIRSGGAAELSAVAPPSCGCLG